MNSTRLRSANIIGLILPLLLLVFPSAGEAGGAQFMQQQSPADYTDRLIVKLRNQGAGVQAALVSPGQAQALSAAAGVSLSPLRVMATGAQVIKLPSRMTVSEAAAIAQKLYDDPNVEYAEPDRIMRPMLVPTDLRYPEQWHYQDPVADTEPGGANLPTAWDVTTGAVGIVIAVIDTGILATHADLASGRLLTGYDFITDVTMANDGDGRDGDPSDPGDWEVANECFAGSGAANSSWHGSHVMGTVGATANNNPTTPNGGAGVNWNSMMLPVRVLGKCGGTTVDIVDAMMWAAGLADSGPPDMLVNTNPADVLNLSLGGIGACGLTLQTAIDAITTTAGAVVVVAAGNSAIDASSSFPGNCNGVITVAATNRAGGRASYSNFGNAVEIAAPGGETATLANGVLSTINTGATTPVASPGGDTYAFYQGTSMATPHVAGIASLMLSVDGTLTPTQVLQKLQGTARAFPASCTGCGAGIVDAALAVQSANNVTNPTADAGANQTADPGTLVALDGSLSTAGTPATPATIVSYSWTQTGGPAATLSGANIVNPTFTTPNAAAGMVLTFELTVTDDGGRTNMAQVTVTLNNVPPVMFPFNPVAPPGSTVVFTLAVSDANGTMPILAATGVPAGATFSPATGVFTWPNAGPLGNYVVNFTATDSQPPGTMVMGTSTIRIQNVVAAPAAFSGLSDSGSSSCFIATAAYGTPMAEEIRYLRAFRDAYLLTNRVGRKFVEFYYRYSPPIADYIGQRQPLRRVVRVALSPLVALSKWLLGDRVVDS